MLRSRKTLACSLKPVIALLMALVMCSLASCSTKKSSSASAAASTEAVPEGALSYNAYYLNSDGNALCTRQVIYSSIEAEDVTAQVNSLSLSLRNAPDNQCTSVLPSTVAVDISKDGSLVSVSFDENYAKLSNVQDILCRAAYVLTLTQVPTVAYVSFYSNGSLLESYMTRDMFISQLSGEMKSEKQANLTLFFANKTGDGLVAVQRNVTYDSTTSMAKLIVLQLMAGPSSEETSDYGVQATFPSTMKLEAILVKNKVCYINFDTAFVQDALGLAATVPIYSLVDSLTELDTIDKVQITIEGSSNIKFRESISLNNPFERDLSLVN